MNWRMQMEEKLKNKKCLFAALLSLAQKESGITDEEAIQVMADAIEYRSKSAIEESGSWGKDHKFGISI